MPSSRGRPLGTCSGRCPRAADAAIRRFCRDGFHTTGIDAILDCVRELAADAGARRPDELAAQLVLLVERAIVTARVDGATTSAREATKAAAVLIDAGLT